MPQEIVARGSATAEGLNGQTSMLFSWQNGMQGVLNTTLFSNTPGGGGGRTPSDPDDRRPVLRPRRPTLAASRGGQVLRWEEPRNRYDQLFWQAEHFARASAGVAGLAAAAAQSGAAESAGDG